MSDPVRLWWWGEDEAPGLASWIARTAQHHESHASVAVETRLLRHDRVLASLRTAAVEGDTPDLHFFWNGIYHIDQAWVGLLAPLEQFLSAAEIATVGGGPLSRYRARTYRAAWYLIPVVWVANRDLLARAGVDGVPRGWDEFVEACLRLSAAGIAPIVAGDGEGDVSVWWLTHLLTQALDRASDVARLALGQSSWQEPRHARAWVELERFAQNGWLDRSSLELTLWDAFVRFRQGAGAFTLASGPMFVAARKSLGPRVEMMTAPRLDDGALAGRPIVDSQGLGIPAHARAPAAGAALLRTLLGQGAAATLYDQLGLLPARSDWTGPSEHADTSVAWVWRCHRAGESVQYVPNLLPLALHFDVCAAVGQAVIARSMDGAEAARQADAECARWRDSDEQRSLYEEWIHGVRSDEETSTR